MHGQLTSATDELPPLSQRSLKSKHISNNYGSRESLERDWGFLRSNNDLRSSQDKNNTS